MVSTLLAPPSPTSEPSFWDRPVCLTRKSSSVSKVCHCRRLVLGRSGLLKMTSLSVTRLEEGLPHTIWYKAYWVVTYAFYELESIIGYANRYARHVQQALDFSTVLSIYISGHLYSWAPSV